MSNLENSSPQNGSAPKSADDSFVFDTATPANGPSKDGVPDPNVAASDNDGAKKSASDVDMRQVAQVFNAQFGETVGMLMRSPKYRHYSLADLEWLVVPALSSGQIVTARGKVKDRDGLTVPVALAFWAGVSEEVNAKLEAQKKDSVPFRLAPSDWRSGDIPWLLDVMGSKDVVDVMVQKMKAQIFAGDEFKTFNQE